MIDEYEKLHWKRFNRLAKVTGWAFTVGGSWVGLYCLNSAFISGNTIPVNGIPTSDIVIRLSSVLLPFLVAIFGALMVRAKPYYAK